VRVTVLGAGPAGLYLAILLRKATGAGAGVAGGGAAAGCSWPPEVTVIERNPPDATFGWGVVFSQESLAALRDADLPTYTEITDTFARWDAIDIHYRGRVLRSRGHSFSAIRRTLLLDILQRRARELGVSLRFHEDVTDPSTVDGDLVVAADGVNSLLRRDSEAAFGTVVRPQGCKYVWFGTDLVFDAFTFIFKPTEHGLFQVHAYPFDEHRSTFIVECREPVWRAAGLDSATEADSIAFCEKLFADELGGHRLLSNRSLWLSFPRVHNASWHHGRTVLIGDAAHTAHFSIGSGTKLAMDDAIALADALARRPDDLEAALVDYELVRQPVVERFQQAADTSAGHFERVAAYHGLEPVQFAVNLLTRSGRVSHANLTLRDPSFGLAADAWFAGRGAAIAPPPLFAPLQLSGVTVPNRAVVWCLLTPLSANAPAAPVSAPADAASTAACAPTARNVGVPALTPRHAGVPRPTPAAAERPDHPTPAANVGVPAVIPRHVGVPRAEGAEAVGTGEAVGLDAAASGAGMVLTELVAVSEDGRVTPLTPVVSTVDWRAVVAHVRATGSVLAVQLGHAGARGATRPGWRGVDLPLPPGEAWPLVAASARPYGPFAATPRAAEEADLERLCAEFVAGAQALATAGVDALELDLAHGRLLAGFLSPLTNHREDGWGGPLANRLRFPLQVVRAVRAAWPEQRPLLARLTAADWSRGGLTVTDGVEVATALAAAGVVLIHVEAGQSVAEEQPVYRRGFLTELSDRIRNEAGVPTLVGGHLTSVDEANTALAAGRADLCLLELPTGYGGTA
jgi:anthraniloyl-CoA monooxygenase